MVRFARPDTERKELAPYPRVIAHRGLSGLCPENTLPAFDAAIGLGVQEIEFDIRGSKDGQLVVCHDSAVDRTSNGKGLISELDWTEIKELDGGSWFGKDWANVPFCRMEDIFEKYGGRVIMNIHVKKPGQNAWILRKTKELAFQYGITEQIYIAGEKDVLRWSLRVAPEIGRCCLEGQRDMTIVENAIESRCERVQFRKPYLSRKLIDDAHKSALACNLFYADTPNEAEKQYRLGIDAILTNFANRIVPVIKSFRPYSLGLGLGKSVH